MTTATPKSRLALLLAVALAVRLPAFFASRHLVFDDGVYGASARAMRAGGLPFRDVFSSQGPLFLPLVWASDQLGLHTLNGPRLLALASAVVLIGATWSAARALDLSGPAALLAAGLVAFSGSILWITAPLTSDGPALALATVAVALALWYRRSPSTGLALGLGLALGAALSIKSLLVAAAVPAGLVLLLTARGAARRLHVAVAVGASVVVALGTALPWGLSDVWDQSVTYHLDAAGARTPGANLRKVISTMFDRDLPLAVAAIAALLAVLFWRPVSGRGQEKERKFTGGRLVGAWLGATLAVLLLEHPLWRSHNAHLVPAAALLIAAVFDRAVSDQARARLPRGAGAAALVALLALVPFHWAHLDDLLWPKGFWGAEKSAHLALQALPPGGWAISDEPGIVWRAGRRTPDDLVDTSILRIESKRITAASLERAAADQRVCAVLVWSPRFGDFETLPERLERQGYELAEEYGGPRALYSRERCRP